MLHQDPILLLSKLYQDNDNVCFFICKNCEKTYRVITDLLSNNRSIDKGKNIQDFTKGYLLVEVFDKCNSTYTAIWSFTYRSGNRLFSNKVKKGIGRQRFLLQFGYIELLVKLRWMLTTIYVSSQKGEFKQEYFL